MKKLLLALSLFVCLAATTWAEPIAFNVSSWNFQGCDTEFCDDARMSGLLTMSGTGGIQIRVTGEWNGTGNGLFNGSSFFVNAIQFTSPNLNFVTDNQTLGPIGRFVLADAGMITSSLPLNPPEQTTSLLRIVNSTGQVIYSLSMTLPGNFTISFFNGGAGNPGNTGNTIRGTGTSGQGVLNVGNAGAEVPEPTTLLLLGSGLAGVVAMRKKRKKLPTS